MSQKRITHSLDSCMAITDFMETPNLLFATLLPLLLPVLYHILKHFKGPKSPPVPPGPSPWTILVNLLQIRKHPLETLTKFGEIYGPLFSTKLGCQRVVVAQSPDAAMQILKTKDRLLAGRFVPHLLPAREPEINNLYDALAFENDESWKYRKALFKAQFFSGTAVESQACSREDGAITMLKYIASMEGKPMKVRNVVFAVLFQMFSKMLVSTDLINFEQEIEDGRMMGLIRNLLELIVVPNVSDLYPVLAPLHLQGLRKKAKKLYKESTSNWEAIINERRERRRGDHAENDSSHQDFLDVLLSNGSSNDQIIVSFREMLLPGSDSSSVTIEWMMSEIIRNPTCMKLVQEELARELSQDHMVTESDLPKLPYLQACLKETLRLHPPAPFLIHRRALQSCKIMNYTIPKGSIILVNVWAIGRDPKYWKDPLVFEPERFLESSLDFKGNNFEFLPFGSGRRMCPGMPIAAKQVPLLFASLLHFFDWSLPHGKNPKDLSMSAKFGITQVKEEPLILIPKVKVYA